MRRGDYELIELIGRGGMAEVWRARSDGPGGATKGVALKLIHSHLARDPLYRELFVREAKLAMQLNSPNIVQVFGVGEEHDELFLVMEWVQGHNLSRILRMCWSRQEPIELELAAYILGELLSALEHAHHIYAEGHPTGIVHRDVTPHNVLISKDGAVKLADFGVARAAGDRSSGGAKGKLRYMAQEHLLGKPTQRSDLFGAGAIFWELIAGQRYRPHAHEEPTLYHAIMQGDPWRNRLDLPAELDTLLTGLLEPKEKKRIASATEALELLETWPGYRHGRTGLKKLYEALFGPESTRTGFTRIVKTDDAGGEASPANEAPNEPREQVDEPPPSPRENPEVSRTPLMPGEDRTVVAPQAATQILGSEAPPAESAANAPALPPEQTRTARRQASGELVEADAPLPRQKIRPIWLVLAVVVPFVTSMSVALHVFRSMRSNEKAQVALSNEPAAGDIAVAQDTADEPSASPTAEITAAIEAPPAGASEKIISDPDIETAAQVEPTAPAEPPATETTAPQPKPDPKPEPAEPSPAPKARTATPAKRHSAGDAPPKPKSQAEPSEPDPKAAPQTDVAKLRIVHFRLDGVDAAYVRIDGKVHVVDPAGSALLSPGPHRMTWRTTKSEPWKPTRTVTIRSEPNEWVLVVQPSGLRLRTLKQHLNGRGG